jgi:DDE family transposase
VDEKNSSAALFQRSVEADFQGSRVTSDGGSVLVRELNERLEFSELMEQHLTELRGKHGAASPRCRCRLDREQRPSY